MESNLRVVGMTAILAPRGRLDYGSEFQAQEALDACIGTTRHNVVIDLKDVPFIDSRGLATLVSGHRQCQELGRTLVLAGLHPTVHSIFEMTRLDRVLEIFPDVDQALVALEQRMP